MQYNNTVNVVEGSKYLLNRHMVSFNKRLSDSALEHVSQVFFFLNDSAKGCLCVSKQIQHSVGRLLLEEVRLVFVNIS